MNMKKACKVVGMGFVVLFLCGLCALGFLRWEIQSGLDRWCEIAQAEHPYPDDDIAALLDYVQSDSHSLQDRNHAVWALGQARDSRARVVLERYYQETECDHDAYLCQRELDKAIKLCRGDTPNLLAIKTP